MQCLVCVLWSPLILSVLRDDCFASLSSYATKLHCIETMIKTKRLAKMDYEALDKYKTNIEHTSADRVCPLCHLIIGCSSDRNRLGKLGCLHDNENCQSRGLVCVRLARKHSLSSDCWKAAFLTKCLNGNMNCSLLHSLGQNHFIKYIICNLLFLVLQICAYCWRNRNC